MAGTTVNFTGAIDRDLLVSSSNFIGSMVQHV